MQLDNIREIHIEPTSLCNAECPQCARNIHGSGVNPNIQLNSLTINYFTNFFNNDNIKNIDKIFFCGNVGDPCATPDLLKICRYLKLIKSDIVLGINTNGSLRAKTWWQKLASPKVTIGFALDGLADTHARYRQDTDWYRIIENAQSYIDAGGQAIWRFVPFDHNRHQEAECRRLAKEMKFIYFENIHDGRDAGPVYTRTGEFSHWLGPVGDPPPIKDMLQSHITWYDSKTVKIKKDTPELNIRCRHKVTREIYLAADGTVYPCCYLGFYPLSMNHPGNQELAQLVAENNALEYPLEQCFDWFDRVEQSWNQASIRDGRTFQCVNTCNQT